MFANQLFYNVCVSFFTLLNKSRRRFIYPLIRGAWQALIKVCVCPVRNVSGRLLLFGEAARLSGCLARLELSADVAIKKAMWRWRSPASSRMAAYPPRSVYVMCKYLVNKHYGSKLWVGFFYVYESLLCSLRMQLFKKNTVKTPILRNIAI